MRILLADDNPKILDHVARILGSSHEIVSRVSNGKAVVAETEKLHPDLLVLDVSMGDVSGIDIARSLRESGYTGKIVFLTVHEDPDFASAAIGAGGSGYVVKSKMGTDLARAVRAVLAGQLFISSPIRAE
jgi:DNA-binding NarL/FixJ family response regulator